MKQRKERLLKEAGASILEQKFAAWVNLTATFHQTEDVLMVATLRLNAEPDEVSACQIWHKQA